MAWCLEGATFKHFGSVRNPSEALFEIFRVKEQKEKIKMSEKIEISMEIFYRSQPKTKISPIFRPKFSTFCFLVLIHGIFLVIKKNQKQVLNAEPTTCNFHI